MFLTQLRLMDKISIYFACVTTNPPSAGTAHYTGGIVCMGMHLHTSTYTWTRERMSTSVGLLCFGSWHCGWWRHSVGDLDCLTLGSRADIVMTILHAQYRHRTIPSALNRGHVSRKGNSLCLFMLPRGSILLSMFQGNGKLQKVEWTVLQLRIYV